MTRRLISGREVPHMHLGFESLEQRVEKEYLKKGYSKARAEKAGKGTAAKVHREKEAKKHGGKDFMTYVRSFRHKAKK